MKVYLKKFGSGLTLIELLITVIAAMVLVVGISGILAAGHRHYNTMYKRITRGVVPESYEVKSTFDRIVRKSVQYCEISANKNELYVFYYSQDVLMNLNASPDRYARFYLNDNKLMLEQGTVANFSSTSRTLTMQGTVKLTAVYDDEKDVKVVAPAQGIFSVRDSAVKMALILDSETGSTRRKTETLKMTITSTAVRHNL